MTYLDTQGGMIPAYTDTWARVEYTYDEAGNMLSERYFDDAGMPVMKNAGYAALRYDGPEAFKTYLDTQSRAVTPDEEEVRRREAVTMALRIQGFTWEDSSAEKAGLAPYDIITGFCGWSMADCYQDVYQLIDSFQAALDGARETKKTITVMRHLMGGGWESLTFELPEGSAGYQFGGVDVTVGYAETWLVGSLP